MRNPRIYTPEEKARNCQRALKSYYKNRPLRLAQRLAWNHNNPERVILRSAKQRAKQFGVPFSLTVEDIVIPAICPVLGIPLCSNRDGSHVPNDGSPSLDRLIPKLGYVKGNIAIISYLANRIKNCGTPEQVQSVADWMNRTVPK